MVIFGAAFTLIALLAPSLPGMTKEAGSSNRGCQDDSQIVQR
jgi:hypothetical protein